MSETYDLGEPPRRAAPVRQSRRVRAEPTPDEFIDEETGKPITRRSRKGINGGTEFDIPARHKKPGWDYQWFTMTVLSEKEDPAIHVEISDGGWRAVRPAEMAGYMPKDWEGKTIDRKGLRLYTRPMHLTDEAKAEAQENAREIRRQKFRQAQMGDPNAEGPQASRRVDTLDVTYDRAPTVEAEEVF
jgi:hypothetical protein